MVTLVKADERCKEEVLEFKQEFFDCGESIINGSALLDQLSFEEWMDLDVKYVKERSFWVDWKIIFKTFKVCLLGRGE